MMKRSIGIFLVVVIAAAFSTNQAVAEWIELDSFTGSDTASGDDFSFSVSFDGTLALCGARKADIGGKDIGAAYLFGPDGSGGWTEIKKLMPTDAAAGDMVGSAVLVQGDLAFVGGYQADPGSVSGAGAVWVFQKDEGDANNWGQVGKILPTTSIAGAGFGSAIAKQGDVLAIAAQNEKVGSDADAGAVYIFGPDGSGGWTQNQRIQASDYDYKDYFGQTISLDGNTLAVGAHAAGGSDGQAYVFDYDTDSAQWVETKNLEVSGSAGMGTGAAISGDTVSVGAYKTSVSGNDSAGTAYVFGRDEGDADQWGLVASLEAGDPQANANFGTATAVDEGTRVVVGAQGADGNTGAIYTFHEIAGAWTQVDKEGGRASGEKFGRRMDMAGDMLLVSASPADKAYVLQWVPEPSTLALLLTGILSLAFGRRGRRG